MADAQALQQRAREARIGASVEKVDHKADAAPRHHQDQGGDDRLDVENGDQEPVPQAAQQARRQREHENDEMRVARMNAPDDDRADNRDHRADREVDPLRADDHGHPERDDRRLVENETLGPDTSARASTTFCWLPPDNWPTGFSASGVAIPSASIISPASDPARRGRGERATPAWSAARGRCSRAP